MARLRWGVVAVGIVASTAAAPALAGTEADRPPTAALPNLPAAPPPPAGAAPAPPGAELGPPEPRGSAPDQQKKKPKQPVQPPPAPPGAAPAYPPTYAPYPYAGGYPPPYYPYPPPYYYASPVAPAKQLPPRASVRASPFVDGVVTGTFFDKHYESLANAGAQVGLYAAERVRLVARLLVYSDTSSSSSSGLDGSYPYYATSSGHPSILWGASAGYALIAGQTFALSPGLELMGADKSFGYFLGLGLPFDWVLSSGLRIGLEVASGRAFGGTYQAACAASGSQCPQGATAELDRPSGTGFLLQFSLGFGFNHPDPQ